MLMWPAAAAAAGPSDMGFSYGLHIKTNYDLPAMLTSPELDNVYSTVVEVRRGVKGAVKCATCKIADLPVGLAVLATGNAYTALPRAMCRAALCVAGGVATADVLDALPCVLMMLDPCACASSNLLHVCTAVYSGCTTTKHMITHVTQDTSSCSPCCYSAAVCPAGLQQARRRAGCVLPGRGACRAAGGAGLQVRGVQH